MTSAEFSQLLPVLAPTAAVFALLGWWLRGKKKTASAAGTGAAPAKTATAPSNSERQRLRDLEGKLRTAESALATAQSEVASLQKSSISRSDYEALQGELDTARTSITTLEGQLKKSRDVQATLQAQTNDAGKKTQARAIGLENELSSARTEILRLKALADPNTDGMKRLEAEIETVRTRLRAVEAQLAERNAELNAQKARSLATTTRAPRTIASQNTTPGAALNLLGVEPAPLALPTPPEAAEENPVAARMAGLSGDGPDTALATAGSILGKRIESNDLTVIEGITPAIANLLSAAGFSTWEAIAEASPEQLHALLVEAGPVNAANSPATWPEQAQLAVKANWFQLKSLQEKLLSGRPETAYV